MKTAIAFPGGFLVMAFCTGGARSAGRAGVIGVAVLLFTQDDNADSS